MDSKKSKIKSKQDSDSNHKKAKSSKKGTATEEPDNVDAAIYNQDYCESCLYGGDLLCCDNCPSAFHFACVNPPMTPEEVNKMKGDWYCNVCKAAKESPAPNKSILGKVFTLLASSNPTEFVLPKEISPELVKELSNGTKSQAEPKSTSESAAPATTTKSKKKHVKVHKQKIQDGICSLCSTGDNPTELISCLLCSRVYHLYCLDPPLLYKPTIPWQCPLHQLYGKQTHIVPDKAFKLDFFPQSQNNKANGRTASPKTITTPISPLQEEVAVEQTQSPMETESTTNANNDIDATNLLLGLGVPRDFEVINQLKSADNAILQQIALLQREQEKIMKHSMPSTFDFSGIPTEGFTSSTPLILAQLTPLFTQFLAWQRLMQINKQIQQLQTQSQAIAAQVNPPQIVVIPNEPPSPPPPSTEMKSEPSVTEEPEQPKQVQTPKKRKQEEEPKEAEEIEKTRPRARRTAFIKPGRVTPFPPVRNQKRKQARRTASPVAPSKRSTSSSSSSSSDDDDDEKEEEEMKKPEQEDDEDNENKEEKEDKSKGKKLEFVDLDSTLNEEENNVNINKKYPFPTNARIEDSRGLIVARLNEDKIIRIGRTAIGSNVPVDVDLKTRDIKKLVSRHHATMLYDHSSGTFLYTNVGKNGSRINDNLLKGNEQAHIGRNTKIIIATIVLYLRYDRAEPV